MIVDIGYAVILPFHDFHFRGQKNICKKNVLKHPFRQDIFKQHIEMWCLEIIS